jgi:hypothetical protein
MRVLDDRAAVVSAILVAALLVGGCGGFEELSPGRIGVADARGAIEGAGYTIAYRKVPDVEGYAALAGRATDRRGRRVEFAVVVDLDGPYEGGDEEAKGGSPQPPVVRGVEGPAASSVIGNAFWVIQPQSDSRAELRMAVRIERAIQDEFGPPFNRYL